jgi:hypothetical protein
MNDESKVGSGLAMQHFTFPFYALYRPTYGSVMHAHPCRKLLTLIKGSLPSMSSTGLSNNIQGIAIVASVSGLALQL